MTCFFSFNDTCCSHCRHRRIFTCKTHAAAVYRTIYGNLSAAAFISYQICIFQRWICHLNITAYLFSVNRKSYLIASFFCRKNLSIICKWYFFRRWFFPFYCTVRTSSVKCQRLFSTYCDYHFTFSHNRICNRNRNFHFFYISVFSCYDGTYICIAYSFCLKLSIRNLHYIFIIRKPLYRYIIR